MRKSSFEIFFPFVLISFSIEWPQNRSGAHRLASSQTIDLPNGYASLRQPIFVFVLVNIFFCLVFAAKVKLSGDVPMNRTKNFPSFMKQKEKHSNGRRRWRRRRDDRSRGGQDKHGHRARIVWTEGKGKREKKQVNVRSKLTNKRNREKERNTHISEHVAFIRHWTTTRLERFFLLFFFSLP